MKWKLLCVIFQKYEGQLKTGIQSTVEMDYEVSHITQLERHIMYAMRFLKQLLYITLWYSQQNLTNIHSLFNKDLPSAEVETSAAMLYAEVVDLMTLPTQHGNEMVSLTGRIRKVK